MVLCTKDKDLRLNIGYLKVDKEHQSKGVGKMLLEAAEKVAVARSWPFKTTSLAVLEANVKGQHCYNSAGFEVLLQSEGSFPDDGPKEKWLRMSRKRKFEA